MTKRLTCAERDLILLDSTTGRPADEWTVHSSLTDLSGEFGEPEIRTTWERDGRLIKDIRHPDANGGKDVAPCEHYELDPETTTKEESP